jgi:chromosome segregation protein
MIGELAGAAELDSKFDEAKLGLCRIEREITEASIRLGEREGFLKELEKDKGETLTYLSAQADFKRACKSSDKKLMEKSTEVMGALGAVNLKAPELYEQKKKEISGLKSSITSLAAEQKSVLEGMEKSEARKRAAFLSVFKEVDKNFRKLSANIFHGDARLALENPSDPFEGDLLVELRADGHNRRIEDMPSGEKPLLALILLLAMRMHKAVPFYILDEADAALDRENSAKLAALLRRLSGITQFIAITHNDTLISAAETTLGVMRTDDGSKMVGMEKRG